MSEVEIKMDEVREFTLSHLSFLLDEKVSFSIKGGSNIELSIRTKYVPLSISEISDEFIPFLSTIIRKYDVEPNIRIHSGEANSYIFSIDTIINDYSFELTDIYQFVIIINI